MGLQRDREEWQQEGSAQQKRIIVMTKSAKCKIPSHKMNPKSRGGLDCCVVGALEAKPGRFLRSVGLIDALKWMLGDIFKQAKERASIQYLIELRAFVDVRDLNSPPGDCNMLTVGRV